MALNSFPLYQFFLTLLKLLVFLTEYSVAMVTYYTTEIGQSFNTNIVKSLDKCVLVLIFQSMTVGQCSEETVARHVTY